MSLTHKEETSPLLSSSNKNKADDDDAAVSTTTEQKKIITIPSYWWMIIMMILVLSVTATIGMIILLLYRRQHPFYSGPYELIEIQQGRNFFNYYTFRSGPDSIGSDGFNTYVSYEHAQELGIINVTKHKKDGKEYVIMRSSAPSSSADNNNNTSTTQQQQQQQPKNNKRASIRLEGKTRFDKGLFILDVVHMPAGCGVWPAFWLTDERVWPDHGEIDILEIINDQIIAKTAMHTGRECSMYGYVSKYDKTGIWDNATQIPDSISGDILNNATIVDADNCWVKAPHQWHNQGCVAVSSTNNTIGTPMNKNGGGIYVLEWDPVHGYIKSWVFRRSDIPANLQAAIATAGQTKKAFRVSPMPDHWERPYAYFAIGPKTGCSTDHFRSMHLIFNLAFCGQVSGAKFAQDCPVLMEQFSSSSSSSSRSKKKKKKADPIAACNSYISSNPTALDEAYWKVGGVYVYQRQSFYGN